MQDQASPPTHSGQRCALLSRIVGCLELFEPEQRRQIADAALALLEGIPRYAEPAPSGQVINIVSAPIN